MAEEIQEAVQIIRVAYEGIEIAMKIGSGGFNAAKKALDLLIGLIDYEKSIVKVNMRKLLMKGGDFQVFQFDKADQKKVMKMLKKYKNKTAIQNRDVGRGALSEKNRELIINWRTIVSKLPMLEIIIQSLNGINVS